MSEKELNDYLAALSKEHSYFIQKWFETQAKPELDEYISHLSDKEKDALFILLIIKFMNLFDKKVDERPQGEWKPIDAFVVKCSVCGVESFATPFCPRCGADMRGAE